MSNVYNIMTDEYQIVACCNSRQTAELFISTDTGTGELFIQDVEVWNKESVLLRNEQEVAKKEFYRCRKIEIDARPNEDPKDVARAFEAVHKTGAKMDSITGARLDYEITAFLEKMSELKIEEKYA